MHEKMKLFINDSTIENINKHYGSFIISNTNYIEEYSQFINMYKVSEYIGLDEETMEKHFSRLNHDAICNFKLSERFIKKHKDVLCWSRICINSEMSCEFMDDYADFICWEIISYYQKIEKWFFDKHKEKLNIACIINSPFVDKALIGYYKEYYNSLLGRI